MFDAPRANEFTQGTVFSCAYGESYKDKSICGLVITARCDAAQEKVSVFSYVPVVPLSAWMLVDGAAIVLARVEAECLNTLRNILKVAKLSESLLKSHTFDAIYAAHFQPHEYEKSKKSQCDKFRDVVQRYNENCALQLDQTDIMQLKKHLAHYQVMVDAVLKELVGHRLAGNYLLCKLDNFTDDSDHVALLREVYHIPSWIAKRITKGISAEEWDANESPLSLCPRFHLKGDISLPVGKLKSPWVEHLMQNFALLFSRIGVKDNNFEEVKRSLLTIGLGG